VDSPVRARGNVPVRPFPWRALDATSRAHGGQVRQLGRAVDALVDLPAARAKLEALVGEPVAVRLRSLETDRLGAGGPSTQLHLAVVLSPTPEDAGAGAAGGPTFSLDAEPALAVRLLTGALGRAAPLGGQRPVVPSPFRAPEPEVAQAFAALLVAAARHGATPQPLSVVATGTVRSLLGSRATEPSLAALYVVTVGDDVFLARLVIPRSLLERAAMPGFDRARLTALGDMPLAIPLVAAVSTISPMELAALTVGDAWIPGTWLPTFAAPGSPAGKRLVLTGPVLLAAAAAEEAARAELTADGQLVLRGGTEPLPWTADARPQTEQPGSGSTPYREDEMNDPPQTPASLLESLADAPVVVRVEIGVAELRAREWAELAPGDVVGLGRRVAEPVILRVAGREVARGELVDLDGEVGVRILSRMELG
jgi:flagellar motor switch/type III secretory pathway protein FliN